MKNTSLRKFSLRPSKNPLIFSHHPICGNFDEHIIEIRGRKFCKGCVFTWPVIIIIISIGMFAPFFKNFTYFDFLLLALLTFFISLIRLMPLNFELLSSFLRINFSISLGFGGLSLLHVPNIFYAIIIVWIFAVMLGIIVIYKLRKFLEPCEKCVYNQNFPKCPGFPT